MEKENFNEELEALDELHKNELDDIVLEKYEKKEKLKKYAIVAGSLIAFFFVVIMIVKVVSDSSSAPQDSLVEEQIVQQSEPESMNSEEFEEVPIVAEDENTTDESLDSVIQEVLQKEQTLAQNDKSALQPATKNVTKKEQRVTPKQTMKKESRNTKAPKNTKKESKSSVKPVAAAKKPKATHKTQTTVNNGHYFIQVGAFLKQDPDRRFLKKIESNGFNYVVKTFHKNGKTIKRVYVGPFKTKNEAKKVLPKVRSAITSGAFIVRL